VLLLAFLTCAFLLFDRGFFQDDALALSSARRVQDLPWQHRLHPLGEGPTRQLSLLTYSLAIETPSPVRALQWMLFGCWITTALLCGSLGLRLYPGLAGVGTGAAMLAATAASDFLTGSIIGLGYQFGVTLFLAAVVAAHAYVQNGKWWQLLAGSAALLLSLWTIDVAALTFPLVPLLLLAAGTERAQRRRIAALAALWLVVTLPYLRAFLSFLTGGPYAQTAIRRPPAGALWPVAEQLGHNFLPWRWALRPPWFDPPPPVLTTAWMMALSAAGALLALWCWWRARETAQPLAGSTRQRLAVTALLLAALAIANVPATFLQMAEVHYRTHVLSRVWAALLLAVAASWLATARPRGARLAGYGIVAGFVFGGLWGGLERQTYFFSSWLDHRRELASIVAAAPRLRPPTEVVLMVPPHRGYLAVEAHYLAISWMVLLYDDPAAGDHITLASPARGTGCRVEPAGLRCWGENRPPCGSTGPCDGRLLPAGQLAILQFRPDAGVFEPVTGAPDGIVGAELAPPGLTARVPARASPHLVEIRRDILVEPTTPWARWLAARSGRLPLDGAPPALRGELRGSVDRFSVQGVAVPAVTRGADLAVEGWALVGGETPAAVTLSVDGRVRAATVVFFRRPDVSSQLGVSAAAGWQLRLPTADLSPGEHVLAVLVLPADGSTLRALPPVRFQVSSS
jgi:hypothetical protein